jgi:hypothetical protein
MAIAGVVLIVLALGFLSFVNGLYTRHDAEVNAERARAGLPPVSNTVQGATPLIGALLAVGGSMMALGVVLLAGSKAVLF